MCRLRAEVVRALQIAEGMEVLRLDRVRGWEGRPVLHSRSWFHPRLQLAESADFSRPLYQTDSGDDRRRGREREGGVFRRVRPGLACKTIESEERESRC